LDAEHHIDTFSIMRQAIDGLTEPVGEGFYDGYRSFPIYGWVLISLSVTLIPVSIILTKRRRMRKILK